MTTPAPRAKAGRMLELGRIAPPDGVTILTIYVVLLYGIPSNSSIGPLGAAGSVALVWGIGGALWWLWHQLQRTGAEVFRGVNTVRVATFVLAAAVLLSYVAAMTRPLPPGEAGSADSGLIRIVGFLGIVLVASDGPPDFRRIVTFVRRLTLAGALYAALGLIQFVTDQSLVDLIPTPGLVTNDSYESVASRSGFTRPVATAMHPLEYALVLSMMLPIAFALAFYDRQRSFLWRWTPPALIGLALALSSSRSAYVGMVVALVVLFPALDRAARWSLAASAVGVIAVAYVIAPRVLTNLRYLFLTVGEDDSAASRTDSYAVAGDILSRSPLIGRGFGTFQPQYRIFDNQYLQLVVEIGVFGLVAFLGLVCSAVVSALLARRHLTDPLLRGIAGGLAASVLAIASLLTLFDAFSFAQAAGSLFLVVGLCSAFWRLEHRHPGIV